MTNGVKKLALRDAMAMKLAVGMDYGSLLDSIANSTGAFGRLTHWGQMDGIGWLNCAVA